MYLTGLDDVGQVSTARDLFTLSRYIVRTHPELLTMAGRKDAAVSGVLQHYQVETTNVSLVWIFWISKDSKQERRTWRGSLYIGMVRSKGGRHYVVILLGSPDRFHKLKCPVVGHRAFGVRQIDCKIYGNLVTQPSAVPNSV